jgi:SLOG family YspA-like protein
MKILVCGGRDLPANAVREWLDVHIESANVTSVIQGGAKGADAGAKQWAEVNKIRCEEYPANWDKYGKAAGMIRNKQMLDDAAPDLVIAFPGGTGTANMTDLARKAGKVIIWGSY